MVNQVKGLRKVDQQAPDQQAADMFLLVSNNKDILCVILTIAKILE